MRPTLIRSLLVLVLLSVQLATVVIVVLGMGQQTNEQFSQNARATLERLAETVSDRTQRYLEPAEIGLRVGERLMRGGVIDPTDDAALKHFFQAELRAQDSAIRIYMIRPDGSGIEASRTEAGIRLKRWLIDGQGRRHLQLADLDDNSRAVREWRDGTEAKDPRQTPAYKEAFGSEGVKWLDAHVFDELARPAASAVVVVRAADGSDAGVFGVDVDVSTLHAFINNVPMAENGSAAIIDGDGRAVAYSKPERLQAMTGGLRLPRIDAVAGSPLKGLLDGDNLAPSAEPVTGFRRYGVDGAEHYGLRMPLAVTRAGLDWWLIAQAPADEFSGGLRGLFEQKLRTLIAAVLIPAIIAVLAVFGLTEPVYRLHEDATTDGLTGCLNREEFRRRLEGMLRNRREMEYSDRIAIVTFDLDGFKGINDRYGHEAGDKVLAHFAQRLRERVRQDDLLGRLGGDEFALAMRVDRAVDISTMINGIRRSLVAKAFDTGMGKNLLGVTAGVALVETGETPEHAMARADQALITGKARRKNRVYVAPPSHAQWPDTRVVMQEERAPQGRDGTRPAAVVGDAHVERFLQI